MQLLRHQLGRLRQAIRVADRGDRPGRKHHRAGDRHSAVGLFDRNSDHESQAVDRHCLTATEGEAVEGILQVERGQARGIDHHDHPRPVNGNQTFDHPELLGLSRQHLIRGWRPTGLKGALLLGKVGDLDLERVVCLVKLVDRERQRRRVSTLQAALDLGLTPELDRGYERHQQRDHPHRYRAVSGTCSPRSPGHARPPGWRRRPAATGLDSR